METQKIANVLNDTDNESSRFAAKNGMPLMIKTQHMVKEMKIIQILNLIRKLLNQTLVTIQMQIFL